MNPELPIPWTPARVVSLLGTALAASAVLVVRALPTWGTVVDDAYISARYSEHLAAGYGLVYNAGEAPVEGYTNLVWTVLLAGVSLLGLPMHASMEALGLGFGIAAVFGLVLLADRLMEHPAQAWLAGLPALFLAATPHFAVVSTNGLETSQFVAWAVWALWACLAANGAWRWGAGALLGSLAWVRPEGALIGGGVVLIDLLARRRRLAQIHTWALLIGVVVCVSGLEVWRYAIYGELVPNTGPAKANLTWSKALAMNRKHLSGDAEVWIGAVIVGVIGVFASRWTWAKLLLVCLVGGLALIASRIYLWMPGARLLVLPLGLVACLAVLPLARPTAGKRGLGLKIAWGAVLALCIAHVVVGDAFGLLEPLGVRPNPTAFHRKRDAHHSVVSPNPARLAGEHLAAHLPPGSRLATRDAGLLAWSVGTDIRVDELHPRALTLPHPDLADIDLKKLITSPSEAVALTVNDAKRKPFYYGREGQLWRQLAPARYRYLGRVEQHYRRHYDLYVREDIDIPPLPADVVVNFNGRVPRAPIHRAD